MNETSNCVCPEITANSNASHICENESTDMAKKVDKHCPTCGQKIKKKRGRPTVIDSAKVASLRADGYTLQEIGKKVGFSHEGVRLILRKLGKT